MHYYTHNIGDFAMETRGLDYEEIGIYITLIDRYASTQKPLSSSWVALAYKGESNCKALALLEAFFVQTNEGWTHPRIDELIEKFEETSEKRRVAGARGGKKKRASATAAEEMTDEASAKQMLSNCSLTNNQEPRTNNHTEESANALPAQASASTPARKRKSSSISSVEKPDDIDAQVWSDWLQIRKAKRLPLTKTAWDAMCIEAEKVGFTPAEAVKYAVERGWASFKAQWVINEEEERNAPKRSSSKTNELQEQFNNNPAYMEANGDWSFTE